MKKNVIFRTLIAVLFVTVSVLWLLTVLLPDAFGKLNFAWLIAIFCFGMAALFAVRGAVSKENVQLKKFYILLGTAFGVGGVCALIGTFFTEVKIILPVIAIVLSAGLLLSALFANGKKWDEGDNEKPGYKNYYQRKEEEEQKKAEQAQETKEENKEEQ